MGSIKKTADGRYRVRVSTGRKNAAGRYIVHDRLVDTAGEAKRLAAMLELQHGSGRGPRLDPLYSDYAAMWLDHITDKGRAPRTVYVYSAYLSRTILPAVGHLRLSELTARDLDRLYVSMRRAGNAAATVRQVHAIIGASLQQALRWGMVEVNVARRADPPPTPKTRLHPPTGDEVRRAIEVADRLSPDAGLMVRLAAATGARRGELAALRWTDIDAAGMLSIRRALSETGAGVIEGAPKTESSVRSLQLDAGTMRALEARRARAAAFAVQHGVPWRRDGYILSGRADSSEPWPPDRWTKAWGRVRREAGLTCRLHDLRHWHVTAALEAGMPLATVSARVGHAQTSTTLNVYASASASADAATAAAIGGLLGSP